MPDSRHLDRRSVLGALGVTATLPATAAWGMSASEPIAETRHGRVRGSREQDVLVFRGIRYARAGRFEAPVPPEPWTGVMDALAFGANAPQSNPDPPSGPSYVILGQLPRPANAPPPAPPPAESEDCLFLNVWTSGLRDGRKRPVMVSLHGGFFYSGSGSGVNGARLAARGDVVFVSLNHRINAFGYTHLAHLDAQFPHSGNAGMLDIIAGLEWIRDNIGNFGGDPARVMVFGTSGGGMKTTFLTASPRAAGLLHRAGIQSGPALRFMERDEAAMVTDRLLHALGVPASQWRRLLTLPVKELLGGYHRVAAELPTRNFTHLSCFAPVIDEVLLPAHPYSPGAAAPTREIPVIIGSTGQEMSFFWGNDPAAFTLDEAGVHQRSRVFLGDRADEVLARYRAAYPGATPARLYLQLFSDYSIQAPVIRQAERKQGAPAWLYRLDYASPALGGTLGATHTIETPFILDTVEASRALLGEGEAPVQLARQMSQAWVAFAATGNPNDAASGLPQWPAYEAARRSTLVLDRDSRVEADAGRLARETLADFVQG